MTPAQWSSRAPLPIALAVVALCGLIAGAYVLLDVPLRSIQIEAPFQRVTSMQVEAAVRESVSGGFLSVNLERLQRTLEALPWVDSARVQRVWPAGLSLVLTEQVAAARWGESGLLNTRGELFVADTRQMPVELPLLTGPVGAEHEVVDFYMEFQTRLLPLGMRIGGVSMDPRGAWRVQLTNGVELRLGRETPEQRMERFLRAAAPIVSARASELEYVDLRYSNGFALGWRPGVEHNDA